MPKKVLETRSSYYTFGLVITTIAIAPNTFFDPINAPKLIFLALFAAFAIIDFATNIKRYSLSVVSTKSLVLISGITFLSALILSTFVNRPNLQERFFGTPGRNNGIIFYLSLLILFFCILMLKDIKIEIFLLGLGVSNLMCVGYYTIQKLGFDWNNFVNTWSAPSSFLGNPNFVSSFSAMSVLPFLYWIKNQSSAYLKFSLAIPIAITFFVIWDSDSIQGLFTFAAGLFVFILLESNYFNSSRKILFATGIAILGGFCLFISLLGFGPLGNRIGVETLIVRLQYWKIALKILFEFPLFGVGLDNYGNYYLSHKLQVLGTDSRFLSLYSDSAHNVFLDIGVGMGILGIIGYVLLNLSVLRVLFANKTNQLKKQGGSTEYNNFPISAVHILSGIWIAYLIQAFISINQIGVAVWGWAIPALILNSLNQGRESGKVRRESKKDPIKYNLFSEIFCKFACVFLAITLIFSAFRFYRVENEYFDAAGEQNGNKLIANVNKWPQSTFRYNSLSKGLLESNNKLLALSVASSGVERFPLNADLWKFIYQNEVFGSVRFNESVSRLRELDPSYPLARKND